MNEPTAIEASEHVRPPRLNNLQVLRALAALGVVYFHTSYHLFGLQPFGGFSGVHVFFVISGFIMAMLVTSGQTQFFRRRLIRILPLYWTATCAVFLVAAVAPALVKFTRPYPVQLIKSLLFIPFRKQGGLIQPVLFLGWTLNFEMFFYAAIAAALVMSRKKPLWVTVALIVSVNCVCSFFRHGNDIADFYAAPTVYDFLLGLVAYWVYRKVPTGSARRMRYPLGVVAGVGLFTLVALEGEGYITSPLLATLYLGGISLAIVSSLSLLSKGSADIKVGWLIAVGDASYALYLIHPFIEPTLEKLLAPRWPWLSFQHWPGVVISLCASVIASVVVHQRFERPITGFLTRKFVRRDPTKAAAPAVA